MSTQFADVPHPPTAAPAPSEGQPGDQAEEHSPQKATTSALGTGHRVHANGFQMQMTAQLSFSGSDLLVNE